MTTAHSEALALRAYAYAETNKIVVFLTRDFGKVRAVAYGARKPKNRFGSSLEPLTHSRLTFSRKEHQELAVIQSCEIVHAFFGHLKTWEASLYLACFAELLNEFSREQMENERLFRLALAVLEASSSVRLPILARYFELWALQLEGVLPRLRDKLPPELVRKTQAMMKLPPAELGAVRLSSSEFKRLETLCGELIEYHLEKPLKARNMLGQLL